MYGLRPPMLLAAFALVILVDPMVHTWFATVPPSVATPIPLADVAEKVTLGGLFAGLLWFVLQQFRDLTAQLRVQNDALITVLRENAAVLTRVSERLQSLEERVDNCPGLKR